MSAVIGVPDRTHILKENACKRHVADIITLSGTSSSFFFPTLTAEMGGARWRMSITAEAAGAEKHLPMHPSCL